MNVRTGEVWHVPTKAMEALPATDANQGLWRFNRQIAVGLRTRPPWLMHGHWPRPQKTALTSTAGLR